MRIYLRGRTWWLDYYVDGRNVRKSTRLKDRVAAEAVLATMKLAKSKKSTSATIATMLESIYHEVTPKAGLPVAAIWQTYTETASAAGIGSLAKDTLRKRRMHVRALVDWIQAERPLVQTLQEIDGPAAAAYAAQLTSAGLSAKTRQNTIADLSTVWKTLEIAAPDVRNPWSALRPRNVTSQRHPLFTHEQEARVLAAAKKRGDGWYLMCLIARHTGLRYGDVATITWGDAEQALKAKKLDHGVIDTSKNLIVVDPIKTARHGIRVAIPIEARTLAPALSEARKSARNGAMLFPRHGRAYLSDNQAPDDSRFSAVLEAAKLKPADGFTFHSWRHTFRTRLAEAGVSTETAMRLCGHTDAKTSAGYDHSNHLAELSAAIAAAAGKGARSPSAGRAGARRSGT